MMFRDLLPKHADVFDVVCRDGIQIEDEFIATEDKVGLVNKLSRLGFRKIEFTSFVHPRAVPQLRDAALVAAAIDRVPGVTYAALVPNLRGAERALEAGVDEVNIVVSASETHNRANIGRSVDESLSAVGDITSRVHAAGVSVNASIATAFGCPFEGDVPGERVFRVVDDFLAGGVESVTLADTTGMANPAQVYEMVDEYLRRWPEVALTLHFHNTRGMGLTNVLAAMQAGATAFDASLGGLGGCPFAPGATGNICTEDLVHMLHELGIDTGIDLDGLISTARYLERLVGHTLPGQVVKAGKRNDLHPAPGAAR